MKKNTNKQDLSWEDLIKQERDRLVQVERNLEHQIVAVRAALMELANMEKIKLAALTAKETEEAASEKTQETEPKG